MKISSSNSEVQVGGGANMMNEFKRNAVELLESGERTAVQMMPGVERFGLFIGQVEAPVRPGRPSFWQRPWG